MTTTSSSSLRRLAALSLSYLPAGSALVNHGTFTMVHSASTSLDVESGGTLRIGDPLGSALFIGDLASTGVLEFDLIDVDDHDRLSVNGGLTLGGTVAVSMLGADPVLGDEFDVIDAVSFVDAGYALALPQLAPELAWDASDFESDGILRVGDDTCLADIDDDGKVGFADLLIILSAWGSNDPRADLDENGDVGFSDLVIVLAAWGVC